MSADRLDCWSGEPGDKWMMVTIQLSAVPTPKVGPPTLHQPRTVATCTEVIFAQTLKGNMKIKFSLHGN